MYEITMVAASSPTHTNYRNALGWSFYGRNTNNLASMQQTAINIVISMLCLFVVVMNPKYHQRCFGFDCVILIPPLLTGSIRM